MQYCVPNTFEFAQTLLFVVFPPKLTSKQSKEYLMFVVSHFADALVAIEVVLPEGKVITATATNQHQDLFWAIRGSYGTLGRLTLITLKLQSLTPQPIVARRQPTGLPSRGQWSRFVAVA